MIRRKTVVSIMSQLSRVLASALPSMTGRNAHVSFPIHQSVRHHGLKTHKIKQYSWKRVSKYFYLRKKPLDSRLAAKVNTMEPISASLLLPHEDMSKMRDFNFDVEYMNARGFLRYQKAYTPPADAEAKILALCRSCLNLSSNDNIFDVPLQDSKQKYELLAKAHNEFQHSVPNSMLHMMENVGDVVKFYCTPIKTTTPYEELVRSQDLPPNLHVQAEPVRFHPDTDLKLPGGKPFVPRESCIVTGLRAREKYKGFSAKMTWP